MIAVDVSASMDDQEFTLQRLGYVEAIRHPDFVQAVLRGAHGRIGLSYIEWSGSYLQRIVVPWRLIDSSESAFAFAEELAARDILKSRGTSISAAIDFAMGFFAESTFIGERRVVDISGDGPNNYGRPVTEARADALARGVAINGLPILVDPSPIFPAIDRYYFDCVVGGPGSFVLSIFTVEEFAIAIRRKLILEVAGTSATTVVPVRAFKPVPSRSWLELGWRSLRVLQPERVQR